MNVNANNSTSDDGFNVIIYNSCYFDTNEFLIDRHKNKLCVFYIHQVRDVKFMTANRLLLIKRPHEIV